MRDRGPASHRDGSVDMCLLYNEGVPVQGLTVRGLQADEPRSRAGSATPQLQYVLKVVS